MQDTEIIEKKIPKPRKKRTAKPKETNSYENDVKMLLGVVTGLIAAQTSEIWIFSEEEISMVSKPLANILERLDITSLYGEYIDYISLVTALGIILTPRIIEQRRRNNESKTEAGNRKNAGNAASNPKVPIDDSIQDNIAQN